MTEATHFDGAAEYTGVRSDDRDGGARWLELRSTMVTASVVGALLELDTELSALELYVRFVLGADPHGEIPRGRAALEDARFWGRVLEQPILEAVATELGWEYFKGGALLRSRRHPWIGATLDAEVDCHDGRGWRPFEGKTTKISSAWSEDEGRMPDRVLAQTQTQMLVTGADTCPTFAFLQGSRTCLIHVDASPEFQALVVEETEAFLERVRTRKPPPASGTKRERLAIERLCVEQGGAVLLPDEAVEWTRELFSVRRELAALERQRDRLTNQLRLTIGAATFGVLPVPVEDRRCWRWKEQEREGYVVEPGRARVLKELKLGPAVEGLPRAPVPTLVPELEASLEAVGAELRTLPQKKRRRARR